MTANGSSNAQQILQNVLDQPNQAIKVTGSLTPTPGGATAANQTLEITALNSIDSKTPSQGQKTMANSEPVVIASDQSAIPVTVSSATLPTNAAQENGGHLASIDTKTPTQGPAVSAASSPVVIASDQSAIPVSQSGTWSVNSVQSGSWTVAATQSGTWTTGRTWTLASGTDSVTIQGGNSTAVKVDGSAVTQPVSGTVAVSNFPATQPVSGTVAATQSGTWTVQPGNTANTTPWLMTINQGGNSATVTGANALKVDGSAVTQPVSAASLPLPAGAATSALQTQISGQLPTTLGAKTSASSLSTVLATDQAPIPILSGNLSYVDSLRNDYSSVNVSGTFVALNLDVHGGTLAADVREIEIFDSSGETLILGVDPTGGTSYSRRNYIFPGGNGRVPLKISAGSSIAVKSATATATLGELDINFYG